MRSDRAALERKLKRARKAGGSFADVDPDAVPVRVGPWAEVLAPCDLYVFCTPTDDLDLVFRVEATERGIRPVAVTLRSATDEQITATDWRRVNVGKEWVRAVPRITKRIERDGEVSTLRDFVLPKRDIVLLRAKGPVEETVRYVADLYSFASSIGIMPVRFVMETFTTIDQGTFPRTTATAWVRKAREAGFLDGVPESVD